MSTPNGTKTISVQSVNGWIIFQQRLSLADNFDYLWEPYKLGFQSSNGSFWLGNEWVHLLTSSGNYKLRMEMLSAYGWVSAEYTYFLVDSEADCYRLHVAGYTGDCGDSMDYEGGDEDYDQNGMCFSTLDRDNQENPLDIDCAEYRGGGWWYSHCFEGNFNGHGSSGMSWYTLPSPILTVTRMMLKKRSD